MQNNEIIETETNNKLKKNELKLLIKKIVIEIILLFLFILVFTAYNRLYLFSHIFASFLFGITLSGVIIYLFFLTTLFILNSVELLYMIYNIINHKSYYEISYKIDKKLDIINFICKCVISLLFIMIYIISPCTISGDSMRETFHDGDRVLSLNAFNNINNNDVVIFSALEYTNSDAFYIKRVVSKEGDKITYDINTLKFYVNDEFVESLAIYEFNRIIDSINLEDETYEFIVPKGKLLVFGDNRKNSQDSRSFGFIDYDSIYGKVILRFYPFDQMMVV